MSPMNLSETRIKKTLSIASATATLLAIVALVVYTLFPKPKVGGDFILRMNEIKCMMDGVNPYDVWHGDVDHPPFYSFSNPSENAAERGYTRPLNAYPPYAYTFALPLGVLADRPSAIIYFALMVLSTALLAIAGFRYARTRLPNSPDALLATAIPLCLLTFVFISNCQSWNYPLPLMACALVLFWALDRKHDVLAGFCWALIMIKPQMGLLLAIPLLLRRKFLTCAVAASTCILASIPPAVICKTSPITMLAEAVHGSSWAFIGCGTFPFCLCSLTGNTIGSFAGLAIGAIVAFLLTRRIDRDADWLAYCMPAMFISTVWSYAQLYCSIFSWPFFLLLTIALIRNPKSRTLWLIFIATAIFVSRAYTFYHGLSMLFSDKIGYSMELHGHLDSINSLLSLIVVVAFTVTQGRNHLFSR